MNPIVQIEIVISINSGVEFVTITRKSGALIIRWKGAKTLYRNIRKVLKKYSVNEIFVTSPSFVSLVFWRD